MLVNVKGTDRSYVFSWAAGWHARRARIAEWGLRGSGFRVEPVPANAASLDSKGDIAMP